MRPYDESFGFWASTRWAAMQLLLGPFQIKARYGAELKDAFLVLWNSFCMLFAPLLVVFAPLIAWRQVRKVRRAAAAAAGNQSSQN